jgi:glycosyltransferase involved in cell wall biosynthesis
MPIKLGDLTIVLPTRNESHNILTFLDSIPPPVMLVVIDASEDSTTDLITSHRPEKTVVMKHPGSVTEARQLGAEVAKTPWLLFTDADVVFAAEYFDRLSRYDDFDLVYGPKLSTGKFTLYYEWFTAGQRSLHSMGIPAASGSNLLIKRRALSTLGGFDLRLTCNEDSELAWRARWSGLRIAFAKDLVVYARDHRRLERGLMRKTLHSLARCALLYLDFMPERWRTHDWGYWTQYPKKNTWSDQSKDGAR